MATNYDGSPARLPKTLRCQLGQKYEAKKIVASVSASLPQVLRWCYWRNSTEELPDNVTKEQIVIELNTDFSTKGMSSQELVAVVNAWQTGGLSRDTMLDLFRRGEILPEGRCNEEEIHLIGSDKKPAVPQSNFALANPGGGED